MLVVNTTGNPVPVAAQGTTQVGGAVSINNGSNSPVLVRDVDAASRQVVQLDVNQTIDNNYSAAYAFLYTVPDGKRLVIEKAYSWGYYPNGQHENQSLLTINLNGLHQVPIPIDHDGTAISGVELYTGNISGPIYCDAGSYISVYSAKDSNSGSASFTAGISGYLVNAS